MTGSATFTRYGLLIAGLALAVTGVLTAGCGARNDEAATTAPGGAPAPGVPVPEGTTPPTVGSGSALTTTRSISAEAALAIAGIAMQAARERRCDEAVAVVDQAGTLLVLLRADGASQQFVEGAGQKAWTALNLRASTRDTLTTIQQGQQDDGQLPFIPKALFLMGGVPLRAGDSVVGAVGAAGCVNGLDDDAVAQRAAQEFQRLAGR